MRYVQELNDIYRWSDSYILFDGELMFSNSVYKSDQKNVFDAYSSEILNISEQASLG